MSNQNDTKLEKLPVELIEYLEEYEPESEDDSEQNYSEFENKLNHDVLGHISKYLNFNDLKNMRLVSKSVKCGVDVQQYPICVLQGKRYGSCGHYSCMKYAFTQDITESDKIKRWNIITLKSWHRIRVISNSMYGQNTNNFIKFINKFKVPIKLIIEILIDYENFRNPNGIISTGIITYLIENNKKYIDAEKLRLVQAFLLKGDIDIAKVLIEHGYNKTVDTALKFYQLDPLYRMSPLFGDFLNERRTMGSLRNMLDNQIIDFSQINLDTLITTKVELNHKYLVRNYQDWITFYRANEDNNIFIIYYIFGNCDFDTMVNFMNAMGISNNFIIFAVKEHWPKQKLHRMPYSIPKNKEYILKSNLVKDQSFIDYCLYTDPVFDPEVYMSWGYKNIIKDKFNLLINHDKIDSWADIVRFLDNDILLEKILDVLMKHVSYLEKLSQYHVFKSRELINYYLKTKDTKIAYVAFTYLSEREFDIFVKETDTSPMDMMKIVETNIDLFKSNRLPPKGNILFLLENIDGDIPKSFFYRIYDFYGVKIAKDFVDRNITTASYYAMCYCIEKLNDVSEPLKMVEYNFVDIRDLIEFLSIKGDERMFDLKFDKTPLVDIFLKHDDETVKYYVSLYACVCLETEAFLDFMKETKTDWKYYGDILSENWDMNHGKITTCNLLINNLKENLIDNTLYYIFTICGIDAMKEIRRLKSIDSTTLLGYENILLSNLVDHKKVDDIIKAMQIYNLESVDVLLAASSDVKVLLALFRKYKFPYEAINNEIVKNNIEELYEESNRSDQMELYEIFPFLPEIYDKLECSDLEESEKSDDDDEDY